MSPTADSEHLAESRLDACPKGSVRFHAIDDDDMVCSSCVSGKAHLSARFHAAQRNGIHVGNDGGSDGKFGYAQLSQHTSLARTDSSTVGAHGREDEGLEAPGPQALHGRFHDGGQVAQTPRPDPDRHRLARSRLLGETKCRERVAYSRADIFDALRIEPLSDAVELGRQHVLTIC